jgi:hypothetical protein
MTVDSRRQLPRWGHGLHPVADRQWEQRRDDAEELKTALESTFTPEWTEELDGAIKRTADLFRDIARQSSRDWFVASSLLSHPSPRLAGRLSFGLDKLQEQLAKDDIDGINKALEHLEDAFLPKMLDRYLDVTRPTNPAQMEPLVGWTYMISSASEPSMVLAGATEGDIGDVVAAANRANPEMAAFGVIAAWRVTDPAPAAAALLEEIADSYLENGYYFSENPKDLRDMKKRVDDALMAGKLVIGNPMHVPGAPKPILSVRPYSHDISNKKFKSDVDGVFEAFRR